MPISNLSDATEVNSSFADILNARNTEQRATAMRRLFVEVLDYDYADRSIRIRDSAGSWLAEDALLIAQKSDVSVVHIPAVYLTSDRVTKGEIVHAAKQVARVLGEDLLLLFSNCSGSHLHIILPDLTETRPRLNRMVIRQGEHHRTVVEQIAHMWSEQERGRSVREALHNAFRVEPVTQRFFEAYKSVFDNAKTRITGFRRDSDELHRFTQLLFNRMMFIYFISRKGWLKFNGDTNYLNALWNDAQNIPTNKNFYSSRLESLFFSGLNNPKASDLAEDNPELHALVGDVPFLNGGLFEKTDMDEHESVDVPDSVVKEILEELFEQFNFTVMESTPYDTEVAVDPEMLGKVFEELVTERHESGAYYTPRPVVSFMCREALKGYLAEKDTALSNETIADFIDTKNTEGIGVSEARRVAAALDEVTVVDPACGSGAYLLGAVQELVDLQTALYDVGADTKSLYDLKMEIIERNVYGVDKDVFATNIAMLRLWLSLAIDYDGLEPLPLPNLDFKVLCGDSLLSDNPNPAQQSNMFTEVIRTTNLAELKADYMRASDAGQKDALRKRIRDTEDQLRNTALGGAAAPQGSVDWQIKFAEVFGRGGFDIAVANPPYLRQEDISPNSYKNELVKLYSDAAVKRSDLYCYFYARALQLLRDGGMHVFVCSNSWLDVGYGAKLQEHLLDNAHVHAVYDSAIERQFSTAAINTIISVASKGIPDDEDETRFVSLRGEFDIALTEPDLRREITKAHAQLRAEGLGDTDSRGRRRYVGDKWGGKYLRAPDIYHHILSNAGERMVRLGDLMTVNRGITTGANDFFFLDQKKIDQWGIESEYLKPIMTSASEARRIAVTPASLTKRIFMCDREKGSLVGTRALEYIQWGEEQRYHQRATTQARNLWYFLGKRTTSKLAMGYMIDITARIFYVAQGLYFGDNLQILSSDTVSPLRICTAMNSTLAQLVFNVSGRANFGGGLMKIQTYEVQGLSIVDPALLPDMDPAIFDSNDWEVLDPSPERQRIDEAVFDALSLTKGEREAVHEGVIQLIRNRKQKAKSV